MFSNRYIFIYSSILTILVATVLAAAANLLKPRQQQNIEIEKIQNILSPAGIESTYSTAKELFAKYVTKQIVVNSNGEEIQGVRAFDVDLYIENKKPLEKRNLSIFVITHDDGEINYVVPVRGKGLWGPIWGYIAFKDDLNTIKGVRFDHKGETPGLGAEINTEHFQSQFPGE
ncbi:MAG TPA: FMN-binding protein, partial [Bacteroidia bacterium]|nr:FMN-binding protein [Bacteroidia bacterium]